ncbi:uncharacterized protein LOC117532557 [Gymnodraco acuticeps]|uniref:Uncharacterized protein LOC117532557 n=1 Tax=Gymnodraco acuticeps TaxID=8218 RepID=A0A6P8SW08_GYMAC|nr:uncharacterized protein LOC117532557 [Gymnodraco acuticeps]
MKEGNIGSIRTFTHGEKDPTKTNKTILLVGETGAGKSTLINALVNYAMGVEFKDNDWYQIVQEGKKSQTGSQTPDVIVYEVFGLEDGTLPFSLTIIDTPGYGDTRGIERDVLVSERLLDLFRSTEGVHEIDAVCLVLKASDCRLSDRLMYVFDSVVSLFGKDIEKNIVALLTHSHFFSSDNVLEALKDVNIMCAKDKEGQPVHFMFDNAHKTEKNLAACIHNILGRIEFIDLKQREIKRTQEALKKHEQDMKNNKDFTIEVDEVYKCKVPISEWRWWALGLNYGGAVCCEVCKENCHHPCTLAWYPSQCEVMQNRGNELYCTVCTGKCHESKHVKTEQCTECEDECSDPNHPKTPWRYVSKTRRVKKDIHQMKDMYEKGKEDSEESVSLLETLQKNIEDLQKEKDQFLEESFQHVVELEKIALNVVSLSTHVHLDFLIEKMKEKGDTEKVKKLEEMKSQMDQNPRAKSALSYMSGKTAAFGKAAMDLLRGNTAEQKTSSTL